MITTLAIAEAALTLDNFALRCCVQEMIHAYPQVNKWRIPDSQDATVLAVAASIAELVANRLNQAAPLWAKQIPGLPQNFYLVSSAHTMPGMKTLCDQESPAELHKRGFLAPPGFLTFA